MSSPDGGSYCPDENDFVWIEFDPRIGHEQAGRRPALVLSPRSYNAVSRLCVLCPITGTVRSYPFEVAVPPGAAVTGAVLADQVKSVSWTGRHARHIGPAPEGLAADVRAKVKALLGIE